MSAVDELVARLRAACEESGFDLLEPLQVGWYNSSVDGCLRLEDFGSPENLAVVVGNTRALWSKFVSTLQGTPELFDEPHPLQRYTESRLRGAALATGVPLSIRFSHEGGERLVAMQRLAHVAGLAYTSETHLSVHATFGPWIALRAAISFDLRAASLARPDMYPPCRSCALHCKVAYERALRATERPFDSTSVRASWQYWLAFRDACPTGREHRYDPSQIRYHYTGDRASLLRAPGK
jgi:methylmalonic aciduria homocystinuria type C protein